MFRRLTMCALVVVALHLSSSVPARNCAKPKVVSNFSVKQFEGKWYQLAGGAPNRTRSGRRGRYRCALQMFNSKKAIGAYTTMSSLNINDVIIAIHYFRSKVLRYSDTYILQDTTKSHMERKIADMEDNYDVICTDYTNWAVSYMCVKLQWGTVKDAFFILGRDRSSYNKTIANRDVQKCIEERLNSTSEHLYTVDQRNCPN